LCARCREPLDVSGEPQTVDSAALESALRLARSTILVSFSARGFGGTRDLTTTLCEIGHASAGRVLVLHVNADEEPAAAEAHAIDELPMLLVFRSGKELARRGRAGPRDELETWLARAAFAPASA